MKLRLVTLAAVFFSSCSKSPETTLADHFEKQEFERLRRLESTWDESVALIRKIRVSPVQIEKPGYDANLLADFHNGTDLPILMIEGQWIESDPSRAIPYTDARVSFFFRGGLEPGETKSAKGRGVHTSSEPGLRKELFIVRLVGADMATIADASMTEVERKELARLRERFE